MSKKLKSSLLCILTVFFIISMFVVFSNNTILNVASAQVVEPTVYTVADETDFYMVEGAQVNVEATGIRFVSKITKSYYNELTDNGQNQATFYAVVNGAKADASKAQMKPFATQPIFEEDDEDSTTFSMNIVIKYDEYVPTSGSYDKAYMTELIANAYVQKADGSWVKAYSPENNQRSMRVVANGAYFKQLEAEKAGAEENVEYKEKLNNLKVGGTVKVNNG